jgi:hypothetical protein
VVWPIAAHAQQAERMRRIGVLMSLAADDPEAKARLAAFQQGLQELGWTEARNVQSILAWQAATWSAFANMRRNWSRPRLDGRSRHQAALATKSVSRSAFSPAGNYPNDRGPRTTTIRFTTASYRVPRLQG